jgi:YesN/AraC family two-component response regulator
VLTANAPGEAIRVIEKDGGRLDLLLTDVIMPEMNGKDLSEKILSICPNIKCMFMSGYTANVFSQQGVQDGSTHFIQKPFSKNELALKVRQVLNLK